MDVLVTYEDGTTELRDDKSPLLVRRRAVGHQWASPPVDAVIDVRPYFSDGWGMWLVTAEDRFLDACAATVELSGRRGDRGWAWRITGGWGKGEALSGAWVPCRVETTAEQIERLTRERDAAAARLTAAHVALLDVARLGRRDALGLRQAVYRAELHLAGAPVPDLYQRLADATRRGDEMAHAALVGDRKMGRTIWKLQNRLRRKERRLRTARGARDVALAQAATLAATVDPTEAVKWAARTVRLTEERDAEKARADAAEKRLADLRAWAEHEAREWGAVFSEDESAWHEVLRRIDGKEDA